MQKKNTRKRKIYHPPYFKFMGFLKENNIKLAEIGSILGCTEQTVSDKNYGRADYKMSEVNLLCEHYKHLGLTTAHFFAKKVTKTQQNYKRDKAV